MLHQLSEDHDIDPWFTKEDLAEILGEPDIIPTEGLTDPDEIPETPEEPIVQFGEVWKLGNHKLLCGDSTDQNQLQPLMEND